MVGNVIDLSAPTALATARGLFPKLVPLGDLLAHCFVVEASALHRVLEFTYVADEIPDASGKIGIVDTTNDDAGPWPSIGSFDVDELTVGPTHEGPSSHPFLPATDAPVVHKIGGARRRIAREEASDRRAVRGGWDVDLHGNHLRVALVVENAEGVPPSRHLSIGGV